EKWILHHKDNNDLLYSDLAWWDAMSSLGTYAYNHPDYTFPMVSDEVIYAQDLGHPFLNEDECVLNDFKINKQGEFKIITGANMAGKSTFLRSVCLSLLMARMGLPVFAREFSYREVKMYTSMRTTDSLQ